MISNNYDDLIEAARVHYENLKADINNASNRVESVRLTALAQEALNLYISVKVFGTGLVYSHTAVSPSFGSMHE